MRDLAAFSPIDPHRLRGGDYAASLLEEAERTGALPPAALARVRLDIGLLLAQRTRLWTGGDSDSVRVETAQSLLDGCLYTVGLALKDLPGPDAALAALAVGGLEGLYQAGRRRIQVKLKVARQLWRAVRHSMVGLDVEIYRSTLLQGIAGFFKLYDPEFAPHEVRITCDYPLCLPVEDLRGVEFLVAYLDAALQENRFCGRFPLPAVRALFARSLGNYREQVFNLFDEVFTAALGCTLMDTDPAGLSFTAGQVLELQAKLLVRDRPQVEALVGEAWGRLCGGLGVAGAARRYAEACIPAMAGRVYRGVEGLNLTRVFLPG